MPLAYQTIIVCYVKQISVQITGETARQMADLAEHWGLPTQRHNTAVIERAVAMVHMLEIGYEGYRRRLAESTGGSPTEERF